MSNRLLLIQKIIKCDTGMSFIEIMFVPSLMRTDQVVEKLKWHIHTQRESVCVPQHSDLIRISFSLVRKVSGLRSIYCVVSFILIVQNVCLPKSILTYLLHGAESFLRS